MVAIEMKPTTKVVRVSKIKLLKDMDISKHRYVYFGGLY